MTEYREIPSKLCYAILEDLIDDGYGERWTQRQADRYFDDPVRAVKLRMPGSQRRIPGRSRLKSPIILSHRPSGMKRR